MRQVSWGEFLLFLSLLLIVYYLFVGVRYVLPGWIAARKGGSGGSGVPGMRVADGGKGGTPGALAGAGRIDQFKIMDQTIASLKLLINKVVSDGVAREDLVGALQMRLKEAPQFKGTGLGTAILGAINRELASLGVEALSKEEEETVWG